MKELTIYKEMDGTWAATCDRIPGYVAKGNTRQEAIENIRKALSMYFPCGPCKSATKK
ncbi:MAG: type II toxin-antitoxin system HicB family antitoxin [Thermodesulfovibrionales bacterium]